MKIQNKPYLRVIIQIFLVISMSIAFSYIIHESDKNIVSAQDLNDLVSTCVETTDGELCQEYARDDCDDKCVGDCIDSSSDLISECQLGTCFDSVEGTCSSNSLKGVCENEEGEWSEDANIEECQLGCCLAGDEADFITEQQCYRIEEVSGVNIEFQPETNTELTCWAQAQTQSEGACLIGTDDKTCRFYTASECSAEEDSKFYDGFLCSHPDLETGCEKLNTTGCYDNKYGVYWFDSCGNKENIYEGSNVVDKDKSWNNGKVLPLSDACSFGTESDSLANQGTCGNCDLFETSTSCGEKTDSEKLDDSTQNVVCRDSSCIDVDGNRRENGESWCYYQGNVLPKTGDSLLLRSSTTPGSRHFKLSCVEGVIYNESCGDYRDYICTELATETEDEKEISTATCRSNLADLCINYNFEDDDATMQTECLNNPDCYLKNIVVDDSDYEFNICAPKYPKGFNLDDLPEYAEGICGLATMDCTAAKVKEISGSDWENKGCVEESFTKQMNDFCMSLGDCGASVNYVGEYSDEGYSISEAPILGSGYISSILNYFLIISGENITSSDMDNITDAVGTSGEFADSSLEEVSDNFAESVVESDAFTYGMYGGGVGGMALLSYASSLGTPAVSGIISSSGLFGQGAIGQFFTGTPAVASSFAPFLGAVSGAIIGAAIVMYLIDALGIGAGLEDWMTYTLVGAGAIGGGLAGFSVLGEAGLSGLWTTGIGIGGLVVLAVVIIAIIVFELIGVGDVKEYTATFTCMPWTPETGGENCHRCGEDGFGCSEYACESLGASCQFLNEGTSFEVCEYIESDLNPPKISPLEDILPEGYSYDDISNTGFTIKSNTEDGCIPSFELIDIGVSLNEAGRCTFAVDQGVFSAQEVIEGLDENGLGEVGDSESLQEEDSSEYMDEFYFGGSNVFLSEHTHPFYMPSLSSLGLGGYDPERRIDFDLAIRCEDTDGNTNSVDFTIRMCLAPGDNLFPPYVTDYNPLDNLTEYSATEQDISIYTNEPADCKWSSEDESYDDMADEFDCDNGPYEMKPRGFECSATVPMPAEKMNVTYYARCKDQPWLPEDNETRNVMSDSHIITLGRGSELKIDSISPSDGKTLTFGSPPISVDVLVKTSGGGYNGIAECSYHIGENYISFLNTYDTEHSQTFDQFDSGDKILKIKCEDAVGNTAYGTSEFTMEIDSIAPIVTRSYISGSNLNILTNEKAVCYYDLDRCNFNINNATAISIGFGTSHSFAWETGKTYHIKCKDTWGNYESSCSTIVKPESF